MSHYYICQVDDICWEQPEAMTQGELNVHHETLELTKDQYDNVIATGKHLIKLPDITTFDYSDEYLDSLCEEYYSDVPTLH